MHLRQLNLQRALAMRKTFPTRMDSGFRELAMKKNNGFTLIELLVVIAIIAL